MQRDLKQKQVNCKLVKFILLFLNLSSIFDRTYPWVQNTYIIYVVSDKILDGKGDEEEGGSKQLRDSSEKTDDKAEKPGCDEDNLVVTRKPSGIIL